MKKKFLGSYGNFTLVSFRYHLFLSLLVLCCRASRRCDNVAKCFAVAVKDHGSRVDNFLVPTTSQRENDSSPNIVLEEVPVGAFSFSEAEKHGSKKSGKTYVRKTQLSKATDVCLLNSKGSSSEQDLDGSSNKRGVILDYLPAVSVPDRLPLAGSSDEDHTLESSMVERDWPSSERPTSCDSLKQRSHKIRNLIGCHHSVRTASCEKVCVQDSKFYREMCPSDWIHDADKCYKCDSCGLRFPRSLMRRHCEVCGALWITAPFWNPSIRERKLPNILRQSSSSAVQFSRRSIPCGRCPQYFPDELSLSRHRLIHAMASIFCDKCGQSFSSHEHRVEHRRACLHNLS